MDSHGSESPAPPIAGATSRSAGGATVTRRRQTDHPDLYSWQACDARHGSCGVTTDPRRAGELLAAAMADLAPGGVGTFRTVQLDLGPETRGPSYVHGRVLARFRRSVDAVVLEEGL